MTATVVDAPSPPVGLYVHFPFCVSICPYCDFVVMAGSDTRGPRNRMASYVEALLAEVDMRADVLDERFGRPGRTAGRRAPLASLYLGGGTPSLLAPEALGAIVERVRRRFGLTDNAEVTLEANPGPDERGDPFVQRDVGVTRISFGAQSFNAVELSQLGRRHSPSDVADAVDGARAAGIGSVNLDLLYDVPGQTLATWTDSPRAGDRARPRPPVAVRPHPRRPGRGGADRPYRRSPADQRRGASLARARATRPGRRPSGRDVPLRRPSPDRGRLPRLRVIELGPIRAREPAQPRLLGASPGRSRRARCSCIRRDRPALERGASRRVRRRAPADGGRRDPDAAPGGVEPALDPTAAAAEKLILGLRLDGGVPLLAFLEPPFDETLAWADEAGLVEQTADGRVRLTTHGRLLSNEVFARLI